MTLDRPFILYLFGVFLIYCSSIGVYTLVSSLNVDEGLGTWSLALAYATSLVAATLSPVIGHIFGCKKLLVIAEVGWLLFILGNAYTSYFTVLPGGFFLGLAEAWGWTAMPILNTYFAEKRAGPQNKEKLIRYYTGYYYAIIQGSAIVGNGISFAVLYIDRTLAGRHNTTNATERTIDYSICGANDCQIANITNANMEQYEPSYPATRYILIATFSVLTLIGLFVHILYLPTDASWNIAGREQVTTNSPPETRNVDAIQLVQVPPTDETNRDDEELESFIESSVPMVGVEALHCENLQKQVKLTTVFLTTLKATLKISFKPKHLLVVLLPIYNGMTISYCLGELTRAYSSCMLGVDKVGVCVMLYAFADCVFSLIAGKLGGKLGRNLPYVIAFIIDISLYIFTLHWEVDVGNAQLVYVIFLMFGCSDGLWQTLITAMYGEYFPKEQKLAFNLWNVVANVGFLIQYSISTALCVRSKIIIQITLLCVAVCAYGISQVIYYPEELAQNRRKVKDVVNNVTGRLTS